MIPNGDIIQNGRPFAPSLDLSNSICGRSSVDSCHSFSNFASADVASEHPNMQLRTSGGDGFQISFLSTPNCSSGGSGPDDIESLGDVLTATKIDVLIPKPLESNVVLDVQQIACGVRHVALVTRQVNKVDFVACGEHHSCAVSISGDLFTWGDGTHNVGLLGHGTDVSHWIPKRVCGPLERLQVLSIACGTWHTALATASGKLLTFGDGSFGLLGHGNQESFT
ncbi:hypothetical protein Pint_19669 [Pistacia integerrima]|uniref:Uncharacterized protein n=1 Tax=Pistacia integerrima TaxID=434235 RepID=A0ACC0XF49_9ROSI|nr:hypothetical protein Pint_19669 [Pistacia integerrima]